MIKFFFFLLLSVPVFSFAQNMNAELNSQENAGWYNAAFKPYEDSVEYYADKMKTPQTPLERKETLNNYNNRLSVFRAALKNFVRQHATEDIAAKALIITCFRNVDVNSDSLLAIALSLKDNGKHNRYADYFFREMQARKNDAVGQMFIPFSMTDVSGNVISSESLKGKYVLVLFWASWCIPCRAEIPGLLAAYHQLKDKNFEVLAVSMDTNKENWLQAIHHDKTDWHNLFDGKAWNDDVARNYAVHVIPKNLLIDTSGKIIARNISAEGLIKLLGR